MCNFGSVGDGKEGVGVGGGGNLLFRSFWDLGVVFCEGVLE